LLRCGWHTLLAMTEVGQFLFYVNLIWLPSFSPLLLRHALQS
jgi:hypothetical protein